MKNAWAILLQLPSEEEESRRLLASVRKHFPEVKLIPFGEALAPRRRRAKASATLTARQMEVLREMVSGKGMKQVGHALGISHKTAESHRKNLMDRLGIHDLPGLVRYALQAGI